MSRVSPLRTVHAEAGAAMALYGPPEADVLVVETFGELELEYAALRKAAVVVDLPQRGVLEVAGADRVEFLNRMITQELKDLEPFRTRRSFWLNRKGRIDADARVIALPDRILFDLDILAAERTLKSLSAFVITEDVTIRDISDTTQRLALHGPRAQAILAAASAHVAGAMTSERAEGAAAIVSIDGSEVIVDRDDLTGEVGLELITKRDDARRVYEALLKAGEVSALRPAGWHALNIARIEAGRPLYNLDFGPDSLPHETGVIRDRVSFTKGCYLGQEVVARMESRGHSKRTLVALRVGQASRRPSASLTETPQPVTGSHVWSAEQPEGDPIGAVTSSTLSPMLGGEPICFAAVKPGNTEPGAALLVAADEARLPATVQPQLTFWRRP